MYSDWITKTNHNLQKVIKTLPAIMTKAAHKTNTDLMSRVFHLFFNDHILLGSRRRALPRQNFLPEKGWLAIAKLKPLSLFISLF